MVLVFGDFVISFTVIDAMVTIEGRGEGIVFLRSVIRLAADVGSDDGKSGCKCESIVARCLSVGRGVSGGKAGSDGYSETEFLSISRSASCVASESAIERLIAGSAAEGVISPVSLGVSIVQMSTAGALKEALSS